MKYLQLAGIHGCASCAKESSQLEIRISTPVARRKSYSAIKTDYFISIGWLHKNRFLDLHISKSHHGTCHKPLSIPYLILDSLNLPEMANLIISATFALPDIPIVDSTFEIETCFVLQKPEGY